MAREWTGPSTTEVRPERKEPNGNARGNGEDKGTWLGEGARAAGPLPRHRPRDRLPVLLCVASIERRPDDLPSVSSCNAQWFCCSRWLQTCATAWPSPRWSDPHAQTSRSPPSRWTIWPRPNIPLAKPLTTVTLWPILTSSSATSVCVVLGQRHFVRGNKGGP